MYTVYYNNDANLVFGMVAWLGAGQGIAAKDAGQGLIVKPRDAWAARQSLSLHGLRICEALFC